MQSKTQKLVVSAMLAALICLATYIIKIPSPLHGYLNLGDCFVLLAGWILSPVYGFLAAGLGSALADLLSGYSVYAPVTFLIKGIMALIAYYSYKLLHRKERGLALRIGGGIAAEVFMVAGYFLFEGLLYGFGPSLVNVLPNGIQGAFGLVLGVILIKMVEKTRILR